MAIERNARTARVDDSINALVSFGVDNASAGPQRAGDPNAISACARLIESYPALARDPEFLYCLCNYDEIVVDRSGLGLFFSIHGFTYFWYDQVENGYEIVDPYGFIPIGRLTERVGEIAVFALPASPELESGVYIGTIEQNKNLSDFRYIKRSDCFVDWFSDVCRKLVIRLSGSGSINGS